MFQKGPIFRCVSLNTHYFIIMKAKRDQQQLLHFGRQIFPFKTNYLYDLYIKATEAKQYGVLRVDLHPASDSRLVLTSDFLSDHPVVYLDSDRSDDIIHLRMIQAVALYFVSLFHGIRLLSTIYYSIQVLWTH